jgi:hypothetical protein
MQKLAQTLPGMKLLCIRYTHCFARRGLFLFLFFFLFCFFFFFFSLPLALLLARSPARSLVCFLARSLSLSLSLALPGALSLSLCIVPCVLRAPNRLVSRIRKSRSLLPARTHTRTHAYSLEKMLWEGAHGGESCVNVESSHAPFPKEASSTQSNVPDSSVERTLRVSEAEMAALTKQQVSFAYILGLFCLYTRSNLPIY